MNQASPLELSQAAPWLFRAGLLGLVLSLAACDVESDRVINASIEPDDVRIRHPIAIVEEPRTLDVFVAGDIGTLDVRTADQIRQYAATASDRAVAPITVLLPQGTGHDLAARAALPAIERALSEGGARGYVNIGSYPAMHGVAAPIRLSFAGLKAKVTSQCGQWPRDLASGSSIDGWENRPYWNYGCAYQSNFAAQVDDPRDLVAAEALSSSDVQMRMRAIGNVRKGTDPGTVWVTKNTNLGQAGAN